MGYGITPHSSRPNAGVSDQIIACGECLLNTEMLLYAGRVPTPIKPNNSMLLKREYLGALKLAAALNDLIVLYIHVF